MILTPAALDSVEWIHIHSEAMQFIDARFGPNKRFLAEVIWHATLGLSQYMAARSAHERAEIAAYGPRPRYYGLGEEPVHLLN